MSRNSTTSRYRVGRMRFQGKTALVTGGARGIGGATAKRFADEGATVVVADFDKAAAEETAAAIGGVAVACDVTSRADVEAAVATAVEHGGSLDLLVTCAGIIRQPAAQDERRGLRRRHRHAPQGNVLRRSRGAEADGRAEAGEDGADLVDVGARQPRPDELLDREGRPPGD